MLALQLLSPDGVGIVLPPASVEPNTTTTIRTLQPWELACGDFSATRFMPFGFKLIEFNPEQHYFDPPVRIYWNIPERFKSLEQIKFITTPAPGARPWPTCALLRPFALQRSPVRPCLTLPPLPPPRLRQTSVSGS